MGEYLDRDAQKFDITQSSMMADGDFEDNKEVVEDKDPEFNRAIEQLRRREENFLTSNENLIVGNDYSDSEDEATVIQEMLNRANYETKTLFRGAASSTNQNSALSMNDSMQEDGNSARALINKINDEDEQEVNHEDDVSKIKKKIEERLETYQDRSNPRRFIIKSSTSSFLNYFEYLVMILAIWNAVWTPLTIGFDRAAVIDEKIAFTCINLFVDFIFVCDIIIGFLSSYVDVANGDEIFAPKMIALHYMLKGSFLVDFMSTFPFTEIGELAGMKKPHGFYLFADVMSLLKAFRLKKILKKIRDMPITIEDKAMLQVMYYAFLIFVYTHIMGCIMWLSLKTNERWIPAVDFGAVDSKVHLDYRYRTEESGERVEVLQTENYVLMYEWFTAWYNSAIAFALVEINARTSSQITMMFCIYVVNAMINAYLIGVFID